LHRIENKKTKKTTSIRSSALHFFLPEKVVSYINALHTTLVINNLFWWTRTGF